MTSLNDFISDDVVDDLINDVTAVRVLSSFAEHLHRSLTIELYVLCLINGQEPLTASQ